MSTENIPAFQAKVATSAELQARLAEIQRQAARTTAEAIAALATETGTPFTAEELLANAPSDSAIPDQDLADVAGGATIVRKEKGGDGFHNLWGLCGESFTYTTDDGNTHNRTMDFNVGDTYIPRRGGIAK